MADATYNQAQMLIMGPATSHQPKSSVRTASLNTQVPKPILKKKVTSPTLPSLLGSCRETCHEVIEPPKPDMATSFLQFCAMCEKQILTPCNNLLYCSEACRRKDGCKPLRAANLDELTSPSSAPSSPPIQILLARTPTGSYTDPPSARIPPKLHHHSSDLDPTEWKPKLSSPRMSEAFRYLSQFHRSTTSSVTTTTTTTTTGIDDDGSELSRTSNGTSIPSLSASLSATPASMCMNNTNASLATQHGHTYTGSYDFNTRPLPLRHNRWYSFSGATPKGTDLVTPHIAPSPTSDRGEHEVLWGKKVVVRDFDQGGMSVLFGRH